MSHYGTTPNALATAMVAGLGTLLKVGATGCLRTLKRFAGDRYDLEAIDLQLAAGAPAMLVAYLGGKITPAATHQQQFMQRMLFSVVCCAGSFESIAARLTGGSEAATEPGVEDLLDLATYYGARALALDGAIRRVGVTLSGPTEHKWIRIEPGKYVAACEFEAVRRLDIFDEDPTATFLSLGLVHSPYGDSEIKATPGALFESDNTTPKQTPPTVGGGVTVL